MSAAPKGLLRWGTVLDDLQQLAADGSFGRGMRLRQVNGVWELVSAVPEVSQLGRPQLNNRQLTLPPLFFGGEPVLINNQPSDSDPPPVIELTDAEVAGPTTVYFTTFRETPADEWAVPASVSVVPRLLSGGSLTELVVVVALIVEGSVIAGVPSVEA